jgi:serine/threonine protein kinase
MVKHLETEEVSAAKVIDKDTLVKERMKTKLMSEIKIHRSLDHKNVVNFQHFFEDKQNVYILLELCDNQTLNELLKRRRRLQEIEVRCYLK